MTVQDRLPKRPVPGGTAPQPGGRDAQWPRGHVRSALGRADVRAAPSGVEEQQVPGGGRWDLRLAPVALGCWAGALTTLHTGLRIGLVLAGVAVIFGGAALALPRWRFVVASALAGLACGAGVTSAHLAVRDAPEIANLVRDRVTATVELTVRDDPRLVARQSWLVEADLRQVAGHFRASTRVLVIASDQGWRSLLPGQEVSATVRFGPARGGDLSAAVLSASAAPVLVGKPPLLQRLAGGLRAGLQTAAEPLDDRPGGLLPGLVVGDTSRLDPVLEQQFRDTGMTHLCAVSGSNVAIVVGCVVLLARWCRVRPQWTAVLAAIALAGFVILVRPSPSVVRAAAMGAAGLLALASGRPKAALPALAATISALILVDPDLAGDVGFTLSVCATAGLLFIAPPMRDAFRRKGIPAGLAEALAVPASAQLACAPVIAGLNGSVSLIAVPANLLAVPAVAPATVIGVVTTLIAPVWPQGAVFFAWLASWPARWLVWIAELGSSSPGASLPWPAGVTGAALLVAVTLGVWLLARHPKRANPAHAACHPGGVRLRGGARVWRFGWWEGVDVGRVRRVVLVVGLAAVVGFVPVRVFEPGWPPDDWIVVACDVGQGDATVLKAGPGMAVVVDTGPEPKAVSGCLSRLGVKVVPLLVLSHFHADHIGGLAAIQPSEILVSSYAEPKEGRERVRQAGVPLREISGPSVWTVGEMTLRVLYTDPLTGTRSDSNNNSVVLLVTIRGVRVLLMGDAETEQQAQLPGMTADVLKVAHHGSSYQETRLLEGLRPRVALVSVGKGNDYGHPSPSVLALLQRGGALTARTDQNGDIAVFLKSEQLLVARRGTSG